LLIAEAGDGAFVAYIVPLDNGLRAFMLPATTALLHRLISNTELQGAQYLQFNRFKGFAAGSNFVQKRIHASKFLLILTFG